MDSDIFKNITEIISIILHFKQYLHSFVQSARFTGRVTHQTNHLYVLHMIMKLAYIDMAKGPEVNSNKAAQAKTNY